MARQDFESVSPPALPTGVTGNAVTSSSDPIAGSISATMPSDSTSGQLIFQGLVNGTKTVGYKWKMYSLNGATDIYVGSFGLASYFHLAIFGDGQIIFGNQSGDLFAPSGRRNMFGASGDGLFGYSELNEDGNVYIQQPNGKWIANDFSESVSRVPFASGYVPNVIFDTLYINSDDSSAGHFTKADDVDYTPTGGPTIPVVSSTGTVTDAHTLRVPVDSGGAVITADKDQVTLNGITARAGTISAATASGGTTASEYIDFTITGAGLEAGTVISITVGDGGASNTAGDNDSVDVSFTNSLDPEDITDGLTITPTGEHDFDDSVVDTTGFAIDDYLSYTGVYISVEIIRDVIDEYEVTVGDRIRVKVISPTGGVMAIADDYTFVVPDASAISLAADGAGVGVPFNINYELDGVATGGTLSLSYLGGPPSDFVADTIFSSSLTGSIAITSHDVGTLQLNVVAVGPDGSPFEVFLTDADDNALPFTILISPVVDNAFRVSGSIEIPHKDETTITVKTGASTGGPGVEREYKLQISTDGISFSDVGTYVTTRTWANTGLTPGTDYWFRVQFKNALGTTGTGPTIKTNTDPDSVLAGILRANPSKIVRPRRVRGRWI